MPPKKGTKAKATPVKAAAAPEAPATVTNSKGKEFEATAAAGRPRRATAAAANTSAPRAKATPKKAPAKAAPAKATTAPASGKKRGRPAKAAAGEEEDDAPEPPKKRGRPAKSAPAVATGAKAPKQRGRPPKGGETTKITADDGAAAEQLEEELVDQFEAAAEVPSKPAPSKRGRGRPPKGKGKVKQTAAAEPVVEDAAVEEVEELDEVSTGEKSYWLMKAEQEDREETLKDGSVYNAKFTIDDLREKGGPEPWDGVRNPTACKNMKEMKPGDLAFFYASGGKKGKVPGIVGIMEIVKEAEADTSAFDENSAYYVDNAKIRGTEAKPRWYMVHVEYRKKLSKPVTLKELQKYAAEGGTLENMQEMKSARLSVSKVTGEEWNFITDSLIEGYEEDEQNGATLANGVEDNAIPDDVPMADEEAGALPTTATTNGEEITDTIEDAELPTTDSVMLAPDTAATSSRPASRAGSKKPASRAGSRAPSRAPSRAASVKPASRAGSLAPPRAASRGRSRTPSVRASSAQPKTTVTENGLGAIDE